MITAVLGYLPPQALDQLSDNTKRVFATDQAQLAWHVVPLVAMAFVGKRLRRRRRPSYDSIEE
jgi:hypothetical protein